MRHRETQRTEKIWVIKKKENGRGGSVEEVDSMPEEGEAGGPRRRTEMPQAVLMDFGCCQSLPLLL